MPALTLIARLRLAGATILLAGAAGALAVQGRLTVYMVNYPLEYFAER